MSPLDLSPLASSARHRAMLRWSSLAALASVLFAAPAGAQDITGGGGVFLGYAFGPDAGVRFHWGLELFAHQVTPRNGNSNCGMPPARRRTAVGPLLQFAATEGSLPRLTLAAHGARELRPGGVSLGGEVGASYRFGERAGWGIHTGLTSGWELGSGALRAQWLLDEYSLNAGLRAPNVFDAVVDQVCVVPGRPLRTAHGRVVVQERCRAVERETPPSFGDARELALAWERDAQYECASVPAFLELAVDLMGQGAPDTLVDRALDAAEDEIRHALLCCAQARRYGGIAVMPTLPEAPLRESTGGVPGLRRLATESWVDGCLGEGQAAQVARTGAQRATHLLDRQVQNCIARDEARHAELAWDIVAWTLAEGGDDVRQALEVARHAHVELPAEEQAPRDWEAWGRIPAGRGRALFERHVAASQRRLTALLRAS